MVEAMDRLITVLAKLPSIGRRSAERMAVRLASQRSHALLKQLCGALDEADRNLQLCSSCGAITETGKDPCRICADDSRDNSMLCVVEGPGDVMLMESAGGYRGKYHVLMGRLSPAKKQGPDNIRVRELLQRVKAERVKELVLALNTDVESDATVAYLCERLHDVGVAVSRIAMGVPAGSGISYADPVTLSRAVTGRQRL